MSVIITSNITQRSSFSISQSTICTCSFLEICRMYNKFISSTIWRVSFRRLGHGCMFFACREISWSRRKQTYNDDAAYTDMVSGKWILTKGHCPELTLPWRVEIQLEKGVSKSSSSAWNYVIKAMWIKKISIRVFDVHFAPTPLGKSYETTTVVPPIPLFVGIKYSVVFSFV